LLPFQIIRDDRSSKAQDLDQAAAWVRQAAPTAASPAPPAAVLKGLYDGSCWYDRLPAV